MRAESRCKDYDSATCQQSLVVDHLQEELLGVRLHGDHLRHGEGEVHPPLVLFRLLGQIVTRRLSFQAFVALNLRRVPFSNDVGEKDKKKKKIGKQQPLRRDSFGVVGALDKNRGVKGELFEEWGRLLPRSDG